MGQYFNPNNVSFQSALNSQIYNEIPFLLKVKDSARNVQKELQMRGFSDLICFDGGGGLYFNKNGNVEHLVGRDSPSGLAIKVKQYEE